MQYADDIEDPDFGLLRQMDIDRWEGTSAPFGITAINVTVQGDANGPLPPCRNLFASFRDSYQQLKPTIAQAFRNYGMEGLLPTILRDVRIGYIPPYRNFCLTAVFYKDDSVEEHQYEVEYVDGHVMEIDI